MALSSSTPVKRRPTPVIVIDSDSDDDNAIIALSSTPLRVTSSSSLPASVSSPAPAPAHVIVIPDDDDEPQQVQPQQPVQQPQQPVQSVNVDIDVEHEEEEEGEIGEMGGPITTTVVVSNPVAAQGSIQATLQSSLRLMQQRLQWMSAALHPVDAPPRVQHMGSNHVRIVYNRAERIQQMQQLSAQARQLEVEQEQARNQGMCQLGYHLQQLHHFEQQLQSHQHQLMQQHHHLEDQPIPTSSSSTHHHSVQQEEQEEDEYEELVTLGEQVTRQRNMATNRDIQQLPVRRAMQADTQKECCICLQTFQVQESLKTLPCLHFFHVTCVDQWLSHNGCCPVDKQRIDAR